MEDDGPWPHRLFNRWEHNACCVCHRVFFRACKGPSLLHADKNMSASHIKKRARESSLEGSEMCAKNLTRRLLSSEIIKKEKEPDEQLWNRPLSKNIERLCVCADDMDSYVVSLNSPRPLRRDRVRRLCCSDSSWHSTELFAPFTYSMFIFRVDSQRAHRHAIVSTKVTLSSPSPRNDDVTELLLVVDTHTTGLNDIIHLAKWWTKCAVLAKSDDGPPLYGSGFVELRRGAIQHRRPPPPASRPALSLSLRLIKE